MYGVIAPQRKEIEMAMKWNGYVNKLYVNLSSLIRYTTHEALASPPPGRHKDVYLLVCCGSAELCNELRKNTVRSTMKSDDLAASCGVVAWENRLTWLFQFPT